MQLNLMFCLLNFAKMKTTIYLFILFFFVTTYSIAQINSTRSEEKGNTEYIANSLESEVQNSDESNNSIKIICPDDWQGDSAIAIFSKENKYYGIYPQEHKNTSAVKLFNGQDSLLEDYAFGAYRIVVKTEDPMPDFIISGLDIKDSLIQGKRLSNGRLYPGETVNFYMDRNSYHLYAKGNVIESKDSILPFSEIQNYKLILREISRDSLSQHSVTREQQLYEMNLNAWFDGDYEGGYFIRWIGDINGDGKLDILLSVSGHFACMDYVLLMSNKYSDKLIEEVSRYTVCGC